MNQELLKEQKIQWLRHPNTIELLAWLKEQLADCNNKAIHLGMSDGNPIKQLVKANTIKEIIDYARRNN